MRKLYLEVEVDWEDCDDVCDELLFEDTEIASPYDGVKINLLPSVLDAELYTNDLETVINEWRKGTT